MIALASIVAVVLIASFAFAAVVAWAERNSPPFSSGEDGGVRWVRAGTDHSLSGAASTDTIALTYLRDQTNQNFTAGTWRRWRDGTWSEVDGPSLDDGSSPDDWQLASDGDRIVIVRWSGVVQASSDGMTWTDVADVGKLPQLADVDIDGDRIAIATRSNVLVYDGATWRDVAIEWDEGFGSSSPIDDVSVTSDSVLVASGRQLGVIDDDGFRKVDVPTLEACRDPSPRIVRANGTHLLDLECADHARWAAHGVDGRTWALTPTLEDPPTDWELAQQDQERPDLAGSVMVDGQPVLLGHPPGFDGDDLGGTVPGPDGLPLLLVREPPSGFYCC